MKLWEPDGEGDSSDFSFGEFLRPLELMPRDSAFLFDFVIFKRSFSRDRFLGKRVWKGKLLYSSCFFVGEAPGSRTFFFLKIFHFEDEIPGWTSSMREMNLIWVRIRFTTEFWLVTTKMTFQNIIFRFGNSALGARPWVCNRCILGG